LLQLLLLLVNEEPRAFMTFPPRVFLTNDFFCNMLSCTDRALEQKKN
jgi:hypothetical protein